ncbi:MAG: hypothetical protein CMF50_02745 [Legionellales bacterium]|nr:hypothetical protein [Legionellales bacterium]|tara:strand:- start:6677 stop:7585 length:909 start_codon:yes stop_codon:yes gene_type:complete
MTDPVNTIRREQEGLLDGFFGALSGAFGGFFKNISDTVTGSLALKHQTKANGYRYAQLTAGGSSAVIQSALGGSEQNFYRNDPNAIAPAPVKQQLRRVEQGTFQLSREDLRKDFDVVVQDSSIDHQLNRNPSDTVTRYSILQGDSEVAEVVVGPDFVAYNVVPVGAFENTRPITRHLQVLEQHVSDIVRDKHFQAPTVSGADATMARVAHDQLGKRYDISAQLEQRYRKAPVQQATEVAVTRQKWSRMADEAAPEVAPEVSQPEPKLQRSNVLSFSRKVRPQEEKDYTPSPTPGPTTPRPGR